MMVVTSPKSGITVVFSMRFGFAQLHFGSNTLHVGFAPRVVELFSRWVVFAEL